MRDVNNILEDGNWLGDVKGLSREEVQDNAIRQEKKMPVEISASYLVDSNNSYIERQKTQNNQLNVEGKE